jgi:hypothetical protein
LFLLDGSLNSYRKRQPKFPKNFFERLCELLPHGAQDGGCRLEGFSALFSFFPLLYTAVGLIFIFAARHGTAKPDEELPPEFLGWIFAVLGLVLFLSGIAIAICILIAGRSLALRKRYSFALVIACIECLFVPFGTILGVFTIVALSRESVRALFSNVTAQAPG